jgi:hypothetical protein
VGRTESADYAESLQLAALLLLTDYINNSGSQVGTGSGPPKTAVAKRWPWGRPDLLRAPGRRVCLGVPCRRWSGCQRGPFAPRGVKRGWLCLALARRPPGLGSAIRVVSVDGGRIRVVWCPAGSSVIATGAGSSFSAVSASRGFQVELARRAGVDLRTVTRVEAVAREPGVITLARIARGLGASLPLSYGATSPRAVPRRRLAG